MRMCQINLTSPSTKDLPAGWAKVVSTLYHTRGYPITVAIESDLLVTRIPEDVDSSYRPVFLTLS